MLAEKQAKQLPSLSVIPVCSVSKCGVFRVKNLLVSHYTAEEDNAKSKSVILKILCLSPLGFRLGQKANLSKKVI